MRSPPSFVVRRARWHTPFFFFNDTATTEIYTLPLHDALPICRVRPEAARRNRDSSRGQRLPRPESRACPSFRRSEEHTSELQSRLHLVCRLLLEKKKRCRELLHDDDRVQLLLARVLCRPPGGR